MDVFERPIKRTAALHLEMDKLYSTMFYYHFITVSHYQTTTIQAIVAQLSETVEGL